MSHFSGRSSALLAVFATTCSVLAVQITLGTFAAGGQVILPSGQNDQTVVKSVCGDGVREGEEDCDDGIVRNGTSASDCSQICKKKTDDSSQKQGDSNNSGVQNNNGSNNDVVNSAKCGNGVKEGEEKCDDGNGDNGDRCTVACTLATCGDGHWQPLGGDGAVGTKDDEQCDGTDTCTSECTTIVDSSCGNGKIEVNEECDDGNRVNDDVCTNVCNKSRCGDSIVAKGQEECDAGPLNGKSESRCTGSCKVVTVNQSDSVKKPLQPPPVNGVPVDNDEQQKPTPQDNKDESGDALPLKVLPTDSEKPKVKQPSSENTQKNREILQKLLEVNRSNEKQDKPKPVSGGSTQKESEVSQEGVVQNSEVSPQDSGLRCFDSAGTLTENRALCDAHQKQFLQPAQQGTSTVESDAKTVHEEIRKKLLGDNIAEQRKTELLQTLQQAKDRIALLLKTGTHTPAVTTYLNDSVTWLDRGIAYFTQQPANIDEAKQMVAPMQKLLSQVTTVIQQELQTNGQLPSKAVVIDPILLKTESLLAKFRASFVALAQGGVQLETVSLGKYAEAEQVFSEIRDVCISNRMQCNRLNEVLGLLKEAQGTLQDALNKNPEILKKVQEQLNQ